jgi:hypothetical protein
LDIALVLAKILASSLGIALRLAKISASSLGVYPMDNKVMMGFVVMMFWEPFCVCGKLTDYEEPG